MKSIPKSLHTVSVLVNVGRIYLSHGNIPAAALGMAVQALGYQDADDPQDLYGKALKQLVKESEPHALSGVARPYYGPQASA